MLHRRTQGYNSGGCAALPQELALPCLADPLEDGLSVGWPGPFPWQPSLVRWPLFDPPRLYPWRLFSGLWLALLGNLLQVRQKLALGHNQYFVTLGVISFQTPCIVEPEFCAPRADGLVGHGHSSFGEQILDISEVDTESVVEPDCYD